jgi:hypothetical protein
MGMRGLRMNGWWDDGSVVVCCYENGPLNVLTTPPLLSLYIPIRMELCVECVCRCHCLIRSHVIHNNSRREMKVMITNNIDCALMLCCCSRVSSLNKEIVFGSYPCLAGS